MSRAVHARTCSACTTCSLRGTAVCPYAWCARRWSPLYSVFREISGIRPTTHLICGRRGVRDTLAATVHLLECLSGITCPTRYLHITPNTHISHVSVLQTRDILPKLLPSARPIGTCRSLRRSRRRDTILCIYILVTPVCFVVVQYYV